MRTVNEKETTRIHPAALSTLIALVVILACTAYVRNATWQDGIALWEDAAAKSSGKARVFYNAGLYCRRQNLNRKAVEYYTTALTLDPGHLKAYMNRGNALDDMDLPQLALEDYTKALSMGPADSDLVRNLHYNRGVTLMRIGRRADATQDFEKACLLEYKDACEALKRTSKPQK
jgi:tetratricopeptide (TPR) repeat protein